MARVTNWRSSLRVQWLGWTVVFGLIWVGSAWLSAQLPFPAIVIGLYGIPPIAAFLIGARFKSEWWGWGPPAALLALAMVLFLSVWFGPQVPEQTSFGMLTPREHWSFASGFLFPGLLFGLPLICALFAVPAYAGVRWGQRREDEAAFRAGDGSDDDSRFG